MPRSGWRGWVRLIVLSLFAGAVINVAVAWAIAAWMPFHAVSYSHTWIDRSTPPHSVVSIAEYRGPGWVRRDWATVTAGTSAGSALYSRAISNLQSIWGVPLHERLTPSDWGEAWHAAESPSGIDGSGIDQAVGWPLLSLWSSARGDWRSSPPRIITHGGSAVRRWPPWKTLAPYEFEDARYLSWRPMWRGLLFNTLFWGIVAATLSSAGSWLLGTYRLRRGRCPMCAYSLAGLPTPVCPECGWRPRNCGESGGPIAVGS